MLADSMLFARGGTRVGSASVASHLGLDRDVLLYTVRREGVCYDSRFVPASMDPPHDVVIAWLVRAGEVRWDAIGGHHAAPVAIVMPEHWCDGARGVRPATVHTCGEPFEVVEVRFRAPWSPAAVTAPAVVPLPAAAWAEIGRYADAANGPPTTDRVQHAAVESLLGMLGAHGIVRPGLASSLARHEDPSMGTLWPSIRSAFHLLDPSASMKTLAADTGLSLRHTARLITMAKRGMLTPPGGWRETIRTLRTKLAVVLLSNPGLSIGGVAAAVGYQRAEAMANAFQHDGLPPPREVRRLLLAFHATSERA